MNLPRTRRLQRLVSWIAGFAILLSALAPTVSQAAVASGLIGPEWVEICSAQGTRWINIADESPDKPVGAVAGEVCAYCFTHAGSFGLVPSAFSPLAGFDPGRSVLLPGVEPSVARVAIWSPYLTRAPPLSV